jgi:hypothetical protein
VIGDPGTRIVIHSVSQRTIAPENLPQSLTVATIPWEDLSNGSSGEGDELPLGKVASELFGVPETRTLDNAQYSNAVDLILSLKFWEDIQQDYLDLYYHRLGLTREDDLAQQSYAELRGRFERFAPLVGLTEFDVEHELSHGPAVLHRDPGGPPYRGAAEEASQFLAEHAAIFMLEPEDAADIAQTTLFPDNVPISYLLSRSDIGAAGRTLAAFNLSPEAFLLALRIYSTAVRPSRAVAKILGQLEDYEIPFGASPETRGKRLREVLRSGWRTIIILDEVEAKVAVHRPSRPSIKALSLGEGNLFMQATDPTIGGYTVQETRKLPRA